jgi:RND family efflux transporter MFP subunit
MSPDGDHGQTPRSVDAEARQHPRNEGDDLGFALPEPAKMSPLKAIVIFVLIAAVIGGAFFAAYLPRRRERAALEQSTNAQLQSRPRIDVVTPVVLTSDHALTLPGSVKPLEETVIYSRADGYVRKWLVDIGDKVTEGQLLAELDTPELDQQLVQARAQLAQAEAGVAQAMANRDFSKSNLERYKRLAADTLASQQDLDQKQAQAQVDEASVAVAQANSGSQRANIDRLQQLKAFARVTAPFAGRVTARMVDRGALVTAGSSTPMFKIAATDPVRVFINVPQDVAPSVRNDAPASVTVREYPSRVFDGKVSRAAGALDPITRTMSTEVRIPNGDDALLAGMYAEVALTLATPHKVFELPVTALMNDAKGLRVAIVGDDDTVRFVKVVVERDTGATVQISTGLDGSERVVKLANAAITEGTEVEVVTGSK